MNLRTEKEIVMRYKAMKFLEESEEFAKEYNNSEKIALAYYAVSSFKYYPVHSFVGDKQVKNDTLVIDYPIIFWVDEEEKMDLHPEMYVDSFIYKDGVYYAVVFWYDNNEDIIEDEMELQVIMMMTYDFDDKVYNREISCPQRLNKCNAVLYRYYPDGEFMHVDMPNKNILVKKMILLQSYVTPVMCFGRDANNDPFVILFPYCKGGSVSATTAKHISKFCEKIGIPFMNIYFRKNPEKYFDKTGIRVYTWYQYIAWRTLEIQCSHSGKLKLRKSKYLMPPSLKEMIYMLEFFRSLESKVESMEGREKGNLQDLCDGGMYHISGFDFLNNDEGEYSVFNILENHAEFFFGNQFITDKLKLVQGGLDDGKITMADVIAQGVTFTRKTSSKNRTYTIMTFEDEKKSNQVIGCNNMAGYIVKNNGVAR